MTSSINFDLNVVMDGLGQGVLIFGSDDRLLLDNLAARTLLGTDLELIRRNGWEAAESLFNTNQRDPDKMVDVFREMALKSERPVRFNIYRSGEYIPCWAAAVLMETGEVCTMITLDAPDWTALNELVDRFKAEMKDAVLATQGHIDLIHTTIEHNKADDSAQLTKRITGFTRLIGTHMQRTGRLVEMFERLEVIRVGKVHEDVRSRRRKITLADFVEDFVEEIDEIMLVDPETDAHDHRSRLTVDIDGDLAVAAAPPFLTRILQDILRNAIMYSIKASPIRIKAALKGPQVQIDITDEGYGIRERERDRVFESFKRARQPQIISEFGYGLSLYLCKHEVEAMNGRIWFESEEGVGTTFSIMLPVWREASAAASSSDTEPAPTG